MHHYHPNALGTGADDAERCCVSEYSLCAFLGRAQYLAFSKLPPSNSCLPCVLKLGVGQQAYTQ